MGVFLHMRHNLESGSLKAQGEAADAGEQIDDAHQAALLPGGVGTLGGGFFSAFRRWCR